MSLGYELSQLINDASKLAGGVIDNQRIDLTADEIPTITTAKISDIASVYATIASVNLKADTSYVDSQVGDKATTNYVDNKVDTAIQNLTDQAPALLDTFAELASAINNDENFSATILANLADKADQSAVDTALALKVDTTALTTTLQSYVTSSALNTTLGDYVTSTALSNAGYATTTGLNNALALRDSDITDNDLNEASSSNRAWIQNNVTNVMATVNYVDTAIAGVTGGTAGNSEVKHFVSIAGQTDFGPVNHLSGNLDVWVNGVLQLAQIADSGDLDGSENHTTGYDYRSQTGTFTGANNDILTPGSGVNVTNANESGNLVKMSNPLGLNDKVVVRTYNI
tara:strand:- start:367 stop:1395 length:1029 start_codon:yes stop_codon:yes gene_type:complete